MKKIEITDVTVNWTRSPTRISFEVFDLPPKSSPTSIAGTGERAWFKMKGGVGSIPTETGELTLIPGPDQAMGESMTMAKNGDVWFTDPWRDSYCRVAGSKFEEFKLGRKKTPHAIALESDDAGWISINSDHTIVRFKNETIVERFEVFQRPRALSIADDGSLWWLSNTSLNCLGRDPLGDILPEGAMTTELVCLNGDFWFCDIKQSAIFCMTKDQEVLRFILEEDCKPFSLAAGADNAIWFTDSSAQLTRIDRLGNGSKIKPPGGSNPDLTYISSDESGFWFTEFRRSRIVRGSI
jgi:streptogramin lyase